MLLDISKVFNQKNHKFFHQKHRQHLFLKSIKNLARSVWFIISEDLLHSHVVSNLSCFSNIGFQMSWTTCINVRRAILISLHWAPPLLLSPFSFLREKPRRLPNNFLWYGAEHWTLLPGQISHKRDLLLFDHVSQNILSLLQSKIYLSLFRSLTITVWALLYFVLNISLYISTVWSFHCRSCLCSN